MAVVIIPKFTKKDITQMLNDRKQRIKDAILLNLKRIGENFVKAARNNDTYMDRTGNLRSSIGYVILYNGQQLFESFKSTGGKEGVKKAKDVVDDIKGKFPQGYVIIGCAGMEYAAAVESRGLDVITASSLQAESDLKVAIRRISSKVGK